MNTTKRITKRDHFNALYTYFEGIDLAEINDIPVDKVLEFIEHELELLDRKNVSGEKKPTATQMANENLKAAILDYLTATGEQMTVSDLLKNVDACAGLSNQKVTSMMTQMTKAGMVKKIEDKRKSYFRAV